MNRKIAISMLAVLSVTVMMVTPVMACSNRMQKVPAQLLVLGFSAAPGDGYSLWTSKHGLEIEKNLVITYDPIQLIIDDEAPLIGTSESRNYRRISNINRGTSMICYDMVWSFPSAGGGFKGKLVSWIWDENTDSPTIMLSSVLRGYGAFEGQILKLSREGLLYVPGPWTGYLFKR
jgi:hypothetical protein